MQERINNNKKIERINELFNRLNLQTIQKQQMIQLNKEGYVNITNISEELSCPEEIILTAFDEQKIRAFKRPDGDSLIFLNYNEIKHWYDEEIKKSQTNQEDINNYLYQKYIGINFADCISLGAAKDFISQKGISLKLFNNALKNNELTIKKYCAENLINEEELQGWVEKQVIYL